MPEAATEGTEGAQEGQKTGAEGQVEGKGTEGKESGKATGNGAAGAEGAGETRWHDGVEFGDKKIGDFAKRHTTVADLAKTGFELRQKLGKAIVLPGDKATDEEIAEFREKMGVPKDAKDYKLALPKDFPDELKDGSEALLTGFAAKMHEANATPAVAQTAAAFFAEWIGNLLTERDEALEQENKTALTALEKRWGKDFKANKALALRVADPKSEAAKSLGLDDPSWKEFFDSTLIGDQTLGSHPKMLELLATVGKRFLEAEHKEGMSPEDLKSGDAKMDELTRQLHDARDKGNSREVQRIAAERSALADKLYGTKKVAGAF